MESLTRFQYFFSILNCLNFYRQLHNINTLFCTLQLPFFSTEFLHKFIDVIIMVVTTINPKKPSKNRTRKEKRAQIARELKQLSEKVGIKPVYYNSPKDTSCSVKTEQKELLLRRKMDIVSFNAIINPKHTSGLGNAPHSTWDKLQTEHKVAQDKYTCANIADYEKKNARYKFNHGTDMPVKRKSALAGISRPDSDFLNKARLIAEKYQRGEKHSEVDYTTFRIGSTLEKSNKHELK